VQAPPPPPAARAAGRDPAALVGPLKRKLEAAEATLARETRTAAELDALLADPKLYLKEPDRAADLSRRRERIQQALERAEVTWMAAAEAYEAARVSAGA
jgi:ATP-binding cassette subfamily F protein 3